MNLKLEFVNIYLDFTQVHLIYITLFLDCQRYLEE
jgi:hypothetical protein